MNKKIILKGRRGEDSGQVASGPVQTAPETGPANPELLKARQHQGAIFDQYYAPVATMGGTSVLRDLAREPLVVALGRASLGRVERSRREHELQEAAEALSHQIYKLAHHQRATEIDLYLSAFNVVVGERRLIDTSEIARRANEFFAEHYDELIRERGERCQLLPQILKRTGKDTSPRLERIVLGIDPEKKAQLAWSISHGDAANRSEGLRTFLLDCTPAEIRELREEYTRIPAKMVAEELHALLNPPPPPRDPDDDADDDMIALRPIEYDVAEIHYVLRGLTESDIAQVEQEYDLLYGIDLPPHQLRATFEAKLINEDVEVLTERMAGFSAERTAQEIHGLIFAGGPGGPLKDLKSDPVADAGHGEGGVKPSLLIKFSKHRVLRKKPTLIDRVLLVREDLVAAVEHLSPDQFARVNRVLRSQHGYELHHGDLYRRAKMDPRDRALAMIQSLQYAQSARELVAPLAFLDPLGAQRVVNAYEALTGRRLLDSVSATLTELYRHGPGEADVALVKSRLLGSRRPRFGFDLLEPFQHDGEGRFEIDAWDGDSANSAEIQELAVELAGLAERGQAAALLRRTRELDPAIRSSVEHAFYRMTEPPTPFLQVVRESIQAADGEAVSLLCAGVDSALIADEVRKDVTRILALRLAPTEAIRRLLSDCSAAGIDLFEAVVRGLSAPELADDALDCLSVLSFGRAEDLFLDFDRLVTEGKDVALPLLRAHWSRPVPFVSALERAYDLRIGRLRLHLKELTSNDLLADEDFGDAILCLEGIDPDIEVKIDELLKTTDIDGLQQLLHVWRDDQPIIEQVYDLLHRELPLRRAILALKIPLDIINETLLHLEGFYPRDVAAEISAAVENLEGESLGQALLDLMADPTAEQPNPRIPTDLNWVDEMTHQIRLAYEKLAGRPFLDILRSNGVTGAALEALTERVFGVEPTHSAKAIHTLLRSQSVGQQEEKVLDTLATRGSRLRERLVDVYNAYYAPEEGAGPKGAQSKLRKDIETFLHEPFIKARILKLLDEEYAAAATPSTEPPAPPINQ